MTDTPFVHLHCHTDYSLLDGACEISQLMTVAAEQKMPAVAMTDHGNIFGAVQFYNAAKEKGIHPVIGCEMYVSQGDHRNRTESDRYNHLVLLAQTQEGYRNLIELVTAGFLAGFYYKPRVDKDLLARHSKGLVCLSACLRGDLNEALLAEKYEDARRLAYEYNDMFGAGNFFLELQDHGLEQDRVVIPGNIRLSRDTGIPLVATNDAHYIRQSDARAHEILLCIQTGKTMSDDKRMRFQTQEFHLRSKQEMLRVFGEVPESLDITWDIAQRCQVKLEKVADPFPNFDVPAGHSTDSYFAWVARQGFEKRRPRLEAMRARGELKHDLPEYLERLEREIDLIIQMNFPGYFLIVWDFIQYAKQHGIPVGPGRGSAAGSLVGYAMEITDIDPLRYGLLFERFLNPERVSFPDVDVDFCANRRGAVIQYVTEKYGRDHVAQIITFGTLAARAAIKDVGRVLDMSFGDVDRVTKLIPTVLNIKLKDAIEQEPKLTALGKEDPRVAEILEVAKSLEGMCRNASVHAAGVVIAPVPLKELVPLCKTSKDEVVTQFDMSGIEKLALLKMDFLGLQTLTIIDEALGLIKKTRGEAVVIEDLPLDDPETYQLFSKGLTSGVFQFESGGMRDILRRYQPSRVEDLIALNALYRPGPIQGGMIDDFIDRKHGRRPVRYDLPVLKEVLEETYGVIVYQEQVMQIANLVAGYSLGEADILRRAMGKKKAAEMDKQRARFLAGARERKYPDDKATRIFDLMAQFAGYGFNKSHSAAYAYLAYVTAYLKRHYAVEFMAAVLTSESSNSAKVVKYIAECREMQIPVLAPDINSSDWNFTPDGAGIRFGMGAVKNLGQGAAQTIMEARSAHGRFATLHDFTERVSPQSVNRRVLESLIKAGAMDSLEGTRSQLTAIIDEAIEAGQRFWRDKESGQGGLFDAMLAAAPTAHKPLPNVPDWTDKQKLQGEKEIVGMYVSGHPLDAYSEKICELATHSSDGLAGLERGDAVSLCGVLTGVQHRRNKEGKPWASLTLEDLSGQVDAVVFSTVYETLAPFLKDDVAVLVRGTALPDDNGPPKLSVKDIVPLDLARVPYPTLISIRVPLAHDPSRANGRAENLQQLFAQKPGDTRIRLRLEKPGDFSAVVDVGMTVRPDKEFKAAIDGLCGPDAIEILAAS